MSCSSGIVASATISKSCRPGPVERSTRGGANSIPAGERPRRLVARQQPDADALVGDDEVLDPAVRLERRPQLGVAHARDDEVESSAASIPSSSSRTAPPTRYASSPSECT